MTRTIAKWTLNLVLVLTATVTAFVLVTSVFCHWQFRTVMSGSMEPTLKIGDVVAAAPMDPSTLQVGDIITYQSPELGKTVVHRVTEEYRGSELAFITQGDANSAPDPSPVPAENVVSKVSFRIPLLGYIAQAVTSRLGVLLLVSVPALVIVARGVRSVRQEIGRIGKRRKSPEVAWGTTVTQGPWPTGLGSEDWTGPFQSRFSSSS